MPATNVKPQKKTHLRATHLCLILTMVVAVGSFGYSYYYLRQATFARTPQQQIPVLLADLRRFHKEQGRFPASLAELHQKLWAKRNREPPPLSDNGSSMVQSLYYYLYAPQSAHECAFWAVPLGENADGLNAYYVRLYPEALDVYKGAPLDEQQLARIKAPSPETTLFNLGLIRQPTRTASSRTPEKGARAGFNLR